MMKWSAAKATAAAYAKLDQKKSLQKPDNENSSSNKRFLLALRCWGSPARWFTLLVTLSILLAAMMYVAVILHDANVLSVKYAFEPGPATWYGWWGLAVIYVVPVMAFASASPLYGKYKTRNSPRPLYWPIGVYFSLLVVGNALGTVETPQRLAFEAEFAVKFNAYYCDSRTLRVCLDGSRDELGVLLGMNNPSTNNSNSVVTSPDTAFTIWSRCRSLIADSIPRPDSFESYALGDKNIEAGKSHKFLDDCNGSREVDAWCGNSYLRSSPLADHEQRSTPSPFAMNPSMIEKYTREWSTRMDYSNVLLGGAAVCLALAVVASVSCDAPEP